MRPQSASTLAYDQSRALSSLTGLGVKLKVQRQTGSPADDFEPSININWHSEF